MIQSFLFLLKYKILKDPSNLFYRTKEFFLLAKNTQRRVLDQYFAKLDSNIHLEDYLDDKRFRYYEENREISFFSCYYFDKLLIGFDVNYIRLIDKFDLSLEKKEYLVLYCLEKMDEENIRLNIDDLLVYPDDLPRFLGMDLRFMSYLVRLNCYNIKYLVYNEKCVTRQRELIQLSLVEARKKPFSIQNYQKNDGRLPDILGFNLDFILYLIENDICYVAYLTEEILESITVTNQRFVVKTIVEALRKCHHDLESILHNEALMNFLGKDLEFVYYLIETNLDDIQYVRWANFSDEVRNQMIDRVTKQLIQENREFVIMKCPFRHFFFQNYSFMKYLVSKDFRWIAVSLVDKREDNDRLITFCFEEIGKSNYRFKLEDFLENEKYFNHRLVENEKMLTYFMENKVPVVQYIDFFHLEHRKNVVENILKVIEKKDYEFVNEDFLVKGKYPIPLSNSYRFMRLVIDKNFNNLAYIDLSMIDRRELIRIINYAFTIYSSF